jgi:hypothetical protein
MTKRRSGVNKFTLFLLEGVVVITESNRITPIFTERNLFDPTPCTKNLQYQKEMHLSCVKVSFCFLKADSVMLLKKNLHHNSI